MPGASVLPTARRQPRQPEGRPPHDPIRQPGLPDAIVTYRPRYDHWIGGEYVPPKQGGYFENPTPPSTA
ncbi:hypothetical protein GCM10020000_68040 [Streptomyces olivoverticillatus]